MTRKEREELRQRLSWLKPKMQVELPVALVRDLLEELDRKNALVEEQYRILDGYICRCGA